MWVPSLPSSHDSQRHLPMVLAKKATGRVNSISPGLSGMIGDPEGNRTPVAGMKTRCPNR